MAELGEPARTVLTAEEAAGLLAAAGWAPREASDRQRFAGLLLARAANFPRYRTGAAYSHPPRVPSSRAVPDGLRGRATRRRGAGSRRPSPAHATAAEVALLPLSALLSQALVAFTIEADNEAEHRMPHRTTDDGASPDAPPGAPWITSLLMWANCLRHLPDDGNHASRSCATAPGPARTWTACAAGATSRSRPDPGHGKPPRPTP